MPAAPETLDLIGLHRTAWRLWIAGYEAGLRQGHAAGYAEAGQDWTDVTAAACRAARGGISHAELERRRHRYPTPPLNAEQIRDQAARSWAQTRPHRSHDAA
jgi:hypothetical protein